MRKCGILLPVFSLSSKYGIGAFSKEAYEFVDFLKEAGQNYWQILPLGPTGYGDSPYQSFSTFAGNPYFIDVDEFVNNGWITEEDCKECSCEVKGGIDYEKLYIKRTELLKKAYENSGIGENKEFNSFCKKNAYWLDDYGLFMALKNANGGKAWTEWDKDLRVREKDAVKEASKKYADEINFYRFLQYFFKKQWLSLKAYANKNGVEMIGDIPIYVAFDSSDAWANPELFDLNSDNIPNAVAGCPPDPFAVTGQLWGNPLYRWDYHKETGYAWWIKRISFCFELYDVVRIDHFRGFDEFYAIPYGDPTAEFGKWRKGPGYDLFKAINDALGERQIIAEDLGFLTDSVRKLVKKKGYPGMKILQFAFGGDADSEYLPHNLSNNSIIYTGTHDNETTRGWYQRIITDDKKSAKYLEEYTGVTEESEMAWALVKMAYASVCDTCIIPMQDVLNLDNEARINTPSTLGGNWGWRMKKGAATKTLAKKLNDLAKMYYR